MCSSLWGWWTGRWAYSHVGGGSLHKGGGDGGGRGDKSIRCLQIKSSPFWLNGWEEERKNKIVSMAHSNSNNAYFYDTCRKTKIPLGIHTWQTHCRVALVIPSLSVNTFVQSSSLESKLDLWPLSTQENVAVGLDIGPISVLYFITKIKRIRRCGKAIIKLIRREIILYTPDLIRLF